MRAAIGSANPVKIDAATAVLRRLYGTGVEIIPVAVDSGVPTQPWGDGETRRGAVNRARAAQAVTSADLGLGLEGGILEIGDKCGSPELYTSAWCAVVDACGVVGVAGGANLLLPAAVASMLRAGSGLGDAIDRITGEHDTHLNAGAIGSLTRGWLSRQDAFEHVLVLAFSRILSPRLYTIDG